MCLSLVVVVVEGVAGVQMARALLRSRLRTVVFVFLSLRFCNYTPTQSSRGQMGWMVSGECWSGTVSLLVPLCQVLNVGARGKPLMTAWWLAAGPKLCSASPVPLYRPSFFFFFSPSASLSVRNMLPVV